jgi:hypothetical protein
MEPDHSLHPASLGASPASPGVRYADWKGQIQMATDLDQLVRIVRAYLAGWRAEQLAILPLTVGSTALSGSEDIAARAVLAAQAELKAHPTSPDGQLLREMSLTMGAAASRLRYLTALRSRERVR